ncbi:NAC domain containing protein 46 [Abeliophyllum distichum]|uniref:NAC domain containing protein 46 n=1 Tax=Abeliophyllum distichum TaxID=126358 RepID=A0ABD1PP00_9LAMI
MHEYRLEPSFCSDNLLKTPKEDWVVCRIFHKNTGGVLRRSHPGAELSRMDSFMEQHFLDSPPPLMDVSYNRPSSRFTTNEDDESIKLENSSSAIPEPNPNSYNQIGVHNSTFPCQASLDLPFQHQDRIGSTFPLRDFDQTGLKIAEQNQGILDPGRTTYKMEQFSQDTTGLGMEMANEMTCVVSKGETEREKPFDDFEDLSFSPSISDLDYLWSY